MKIYMCCGSSNGVVVAQFGVVVAQFGVVVAQLIKATVFHQTACSSSGFDPGIPHSLLCTYDK
jgi:hypothetical protein